MNDYLILLLGYFIIINLVGFFVMGNDKSRAKKQKRRIRESSLWRIAFLGGAPGCYAGMRNYRHKTKHKSFKYGLPALTVVQLITYGALTIIALQ